MKWGRFILVALVACGVVALLGTALWPRELEPEYQGKSLSDWLLYEKPAWATVTAASPQREAIRQIGASALPWLLRWVQYKSPPWRQKLSPIFGEDWRVERGQAAWEAFRVLGPKA